MTAEPEMILELPAKSGCARESAFSETDLAGRNCVWVERYGSMTVAGPIVTIAVKYRQLE